MLGNKPTASTKAGQMSVGSYICKEIDPRLACNVRYCCLKANEEGIAQWGRAGRHLWGAGSLPGQLQ